MLGKVSLFALFMLCLAVYQVSAQGEGPEGPAGPPTEQTPGEEGETEFDLEPMDGEEDPIDEDEDPIDEDEDPIDEDDGGDAGASGPRGQPGPQGPLDPGPTLGPRPTPPPRPAPFRRCAANTLRRYVSKRYRIGRQYVTCRGYLILRRCSGQCFSLFYTNPQTLAPVKRCSCCKPSQQYLTTYYVTLNCGRYGTRRATFPVIQARSCRCQNC